MIEWKRVRSSVRVTQIAGLMIAGLFGAVSVASTVQPNISLSAEPGSSQSIGLMGNTLEQNVRFFLDPESMSDPVIDNSIDAYHYLLHMSLPVLLRQCDHRDDMSMDYPYRKEITSAHQLWYPLYAQSIRRGHELVVQRLAQQHLSLPVYLMWWSQSKLGWLYPASILAKDSPCRDYLFDFYRMTENAKQSRKKH